MCVASALTAERRRADVDIPTDDATQPSHCPAISYTRMAAPLHQLTHVFTHSHCSQGFVGALGLAWDGEAKVVAIKSGKRNRFAVMDGQLTSGSLAQFVDKILGGDVQYSPLKEALEVVPAYLQDV